jgi:hypothetical protein
MFKNKWPNPACRNIEVAKVHGLEKASLGLNENSSKGKMNQRKYAAKQIKKNTSVQVGRK